MSRAAVLLTPPEECQPPKGCPIGEVFGCLTVTRDAGPKYGTGKQAGWPYWEARCACGNVAEYRASRIRSGRSQRCFKCAGIERAKKRVIHGHASKAGGESLTYQCWSALKGRCTNPSLHNYHRYGGRGITICDRWRDSFENFLADMGEKPRGMSIDRIDNNKGYEPRNCRWGTAKEQANNRHTNRRIMINGILDTYAGHEDRHDVYAGRIGYLAKRADRMKISLDDGIGIPLWWVHHRRFSNKDASPS